MNGRQRRILVDALIVCGVVLGFAAGVTMVAWGLLQLFS